MSNSEFAPKPVITETDQLHNSGVALIDKLPDFMTTNEYQQKTEVNHEPLYEMAGSAALSQTVETSGPETLNADKIQSATARFEKTLAESHEATDKNTEELLTYFKPDQALEIQGKTFYISPVFSIEGKGRAHAVGYTELKDGTIAPRLFYKSNSDGFWRVTPYVEQNQQTGGNYYSKGDTMDFGYARETKLNDNLENMLEKGEASTQSLNPGQLEWVLGHFQADKLGKTNTYEDEAFEVRIPKSPEIYTFKPGEGFVTADGKPAREVLANIHIREDKVPDFTQAPIKSAKRNHTLLGEVQVDTFESRDGLLTWRMAHTPDGTVWINGLSSKRENVTSYGTDDEVLSAGVLDNKPIEYASQTAGLEEGIDYAPTAHKGYVELRVLDNLEPIKQFRQATHIFRQAA